MHAAGIPQHEWTEDRLRRGELDRAALLHATLTDLLVLARARALVGHFASNLSRLAFSLAACAPCAPRPAPRARPRPPHRATRLNSTWGAARAHWGGPMPFVSVDGAWCYHWQMCCEVDAEGRSHMCS